MVWVATAFVVLLVFVTAVAFRRAERRADDARISPSVTANETGVPELERRLLSLGDDPELDVRLTEPGRVSVTWNLDTSVAPPEGADDRDTQMLELLLDEQPRAVVVRYAVGEVDDEPAETGPEIRWEWPLTPDFVDEHAPTSRHRSMSGLVSRVRAVVLESGFAWQPSVAVSS